MPSSPHYLDHHSTTPVLPEVLDAMRPYFLEHYGNPAALTHVHGRDAAKALRTAREVVATFLDADSSEVFFTSGATESNNLALRGLFENRSLTRHFVTSPIEHKSVSQPLEWLRSKGAVVSQVAVSDEGIVDLDRLRGLFLSERVDCVTIMTANGEVGSIQPVNEMGALCREHESVFHTDATQAIGKIPFSMRESGAHLVSLSAHKLYGPKGVGALIVRKGTKLEPLFQGGGQEKGLRSGTVNVPGVVGFAKAIELRGREMTEEAERLTKLRERLRGRMMNEIDAVLVHGPRGLRLPGNLNVSFRGVDAESLMMGMRNFSLSSGSACSSGDREPSPVLRAIGVDSSLAMSSIRIGLGRSTTEETIDLFMAELKVMISKLRELSSEHTS